LEEIGAAPKALYMAELNASKLTTALKEALKPKYRQAAEALGKALAVEGDGAMAAATLWHEHMLKSGAYLSPCNIMPSRVAVWRLRSNPSLKFSAIVAHVFNQEKVFEYRSLDLIQATNWEAFKVLGGPKISGDSENDIVRQKRIAQGEFDFVQVAGVTVTGHIHGDGLGSNNESADGTQKEFIAQVMSRWRHLLMENEQKANSTPKVC
jgi:hypothetical protein